MSRLRQYSASLIERASANLSGLNLVILIVFTALGGVALFFAFHHANERFVPIFEGRTFNSLDVERIESAFSAAQLADYRFVENRLEVAFDERQHYVNAINDGNILANGFNSALSEAIQNTSILDSSQQTRMRNQLAIGSDIGKLLCRMHEVQNAFVQFVEEPQPGLHRRNKVTASVMIECKAGKRLTDANIENIRRLVSTIRPGLSEDGITVTEFSDQKMMVHAAGDTLREKTGLERSVAVQQQFESHWERKVREAVDYIPAARITVTAESVNEPSQNTTESPTTPFRPAKLAVLVNIPTSYYHRIWHAKASEAGITGARRPTYDDLRRLRLQTEHKIKSNVKTLTAAHVNSEVTVTSFADEVSVASMTDGTPAELPAWKFMGIVGLVILIVSAFHLQAKRLAKSDHERPVNSHEANWEKSQLKVTSPTTDELRKQISDVIREDPETAAQVLGEWMKKAG